MPRTRDGDKTEEDFFLFKSQAIRAGSKVSCPELFSVLHRYLYNYTKIKLHLSLLIHDEVVLFTGMFSTGMSVEVQRVHQQKIFYLGLAFFF